MHKPQITAIVSIVAVGALLGACTAAASTTTDDTINLRLIHIDGGPELDPAVSWYADRVEELSEGDITVEIVHGCCGDDAEVEKRVVDEVAAGKAELGWVGTRVFDTLGVAPLRAYTAPMLIDSYPLEQSVIESDFAAESLSALDALNVRGLALMPGLLRKPLSSHRPLISPADWGGTTISSFHSELNALSFTALEASPLDLGFVERDEGLYDRSIQAAENSLSFQNADRYQILPYATINVPLWPRISSLIAHPGAFDNLGEAGARVLLQAASDVAARTGELAAIDAAAIVSGCERGAVFSTASAEDLAALKAEFAPVYEVLKRDSDTRRLLAFIQRAKKAVGATAELTVPEGCIGRIPDPTASAPPAGDSSAVNGSYTRGPRSVDELIAAGMTPQDAENAAGSFSFVFDDGRFELIADWYKGKTFRCDGSYTVSSSRITVELLPGDCGPGGEYFDAAFGISAEGILFTDVTATVVSDEILIAGGRWRAVS